MTLVRALYFCTARYNMHIMITHTIGTNNCIADAISRFQMNRFRSLAPHASSHTDPILDLLTPSSANCEVAVSA